MTMSASLDSRSTAAIDAVTTESWWGRSSRISPSRSDSPESRTLALAYRWRRCTPSQSSSGAAPCIPHTQACTCRVIGRVTPGGENVAQDRALNSVDFPLPVPPARATTVWLPDRRSRSPARLSTASASSSSDLLKPVTSSWPCARDSTWIPWPWRARPMRTSSASASRRADRFSPVRCGPTDGSMPMRPPRYRSSAAVEGGQCLLIRSQARSSGRLERVFRLVKPDGGDGVDLARLANDLAEPQQLLIEQQPDPLAQVVPGPRDQLLGLGVADGGGEHFPGHRAYPVLAFAGGLPWRRDERADR